MVHKYEIKIKTQRRHPGVLYNIEYKLVRQHNKVYLFTI